MQRKNCVFTDFFIVLLSFSVKAQLIKFRLWYRLILYKRNHLSERWTDIDDWQVRRLTPVIICAGYFCSLGFPYISYLEFLCSTLSRAAFYVLHFQRPSLSLYLCFDLQPITLVCSMPFIVLHVFTLFVKLCVCRCSVKNYLISLRLCLQIPTGTLSLKVHSMDLAVSVPVLRSVSLTTQSREL